MVVKVAAAVVVPSHDDGRALARQLLEEQEREAARARRRVALVSGDAGHDLQQS